MSLILFVCVTNAALMIINMAILQHSCARSLPGSLKPQTPWDLDLELELEPVPDLAPWSLAWSTCDR